VGWFRTPVPARAPSPEDLYDQADFITLHLPKTAETRGFLNAAAFARMRAGVRVINCARGELVDDAALKDALDSGKVAGAALDVFPSEPITDYPLFGYPTVVVTPHLGASTTEAQDRAGVQTAEQVVAALTGGVVSTAVNIPAIAPEDMDVLGPFIPLVDRLARLAMSLAAGMSIDRVELEYFGRIAERDTRLLTLAALRGVLHGHAEEDVNLVNAQSLADERGIGISERSETAARDFTDLLRVTIVSGTERYRVAGTVLGRQERPHLLEAWGQRFNLQLDEGAHMALFRYCDLPGMMGRVGTLLGERGVNISSAAVGRQPPGADGRRDDVAVMVVTTDSPVPRDVVEQIARSDGFLAGRAVSL
jgi:D-3-phosphoglycerate dehydrogenase / 2-oxoglutarate reductase